MSSEITFQNIGAAAQGRWPSILRLIGLPPAALSGKHTACPHCGGRDRFRFDDVDGRGTFICNSCGAGDGFELVARVFCSGSKKAALHKVAELVGACSSDLKHVSKSFSAVGLQIRGWTQEAKHGNL